MKVAITAIAKNEIDNVAGFVEACHEADVIGVLDTGSTDGTREKLDALGALIGTAEITPFRFDEARNQALDALPVDIDVVISIDLDERLQPGWREALEQAWSDKYDSLSYWYVAEWQDEAMTIPAVQSWRSKIFKRQGMKWFRQVHEVPLKTDGSDPTLGFCKEIIVHHYQTGERNYEPLLSALIAESPDKIEAYVQRAVEWGKLGEFEKCIADYQTYIKLTVEYEYTDRSCTKYQHIDGQRAYAHIGIAQARHKLGQNAQLIIDELLQSVAACPNLREAWVYLADGFSSVGNYPMAYGAAMTALNITSNGIHSMDARCWGEYPKDLADNAFVKILAGEGNGGVGLGGAPAAPHPNSTQQVVRSQVPQVPPRAAQTPHRLGQSIPDGALKQYFVELVSLVKDVPGNIVECGVCHGYSFTQIALAVYQSGEDRILYGLDVWDIMPKPTKEDTSVLREQGISESLARFEPEGSQGTPQEVKQRLLDSGLPADWVEKHVVLIKGRIEKTLDTLKDEQLALVHLDVDLYKAYQYALPRTWPLLQKGGILALDEYTDLWWPGGRKAVDEYFVDKRNECKFDMRPVGEATRCFVQKLI